MPIAIPIPTWAARADAGASRHSSLRRAGMVPPGNQLGIGPDSDEGPAACSPYPGGISAASPGSRSAPRVHLEKETTPEGLKNPQPSHPCRGTESKETPFSPGACFARPGAIGSHPSGMPARRRRGSGSGIDWVKAVTQGDEDVATLVRRDRDRGAFWAFLQSRVAYATRGCKRAGCWRQ
jgi:hypothetical protein